MKAFQPRQLLLVALAGWINRQQQEVIAYIQARISHFLARISHASGPARVERWSVRKTLLPGHSA
jgi:hypothetical protein